MKVINVLLVIVLVLGLLFYIAPSMMYSMGVCEDNTANSLMMLITPLVLGPIFGILLIIKFIAKIFGK